MLHVEWRCNGRTWSKVQKVWQRVIISLEIDELIASASNLVFSALVSCHKLSSLWYPEYAAGRIGNIYIGLNNLTPLISAYQSAFSLFRRFHTEFVM